MSDRSILRRRKTLTAVRPATTGPISRRSPLSQPQKSQTKRLNGTHQHHEKGTNIQVVLRCRGRNEAELAADSPVILEPSGHNEVLLTTSNRTFTFDRVFDQHTTQQHIYSEVVQPILDQVMEGFNCTIFAYGQTGSGKTYTMEGNLDHNTHDAGIIPRVIDKLFSALDQQGKEYSVKVSLLELYNEELRDLLNPLHNNENGHSQIKLFEDKLTSGIVVQGVEEKYIENAQEGLRVLRKGIQYRSTGATKINEKSSRSHCIFSLVAHIREAVPGGEDVFRVGKLNLVDLAGSENIYRSGAEQIRAKEAGMINQSLLTLGRVINHLVEKSPHIPYRESKLTRLLKDSLGGRTRTCIIATVSIAKLNQEEIISTLDYANRAKNIRNRPETNQPTNRNVHIRDLELKIEQLKADLYASYEKNGVYMTQKSYEAMKDEMQQLKDTVKDKQDRLDCARLDVLNTEARLRDVTAKMDSVVRDTDRRLEQVKKDEQASRAQHVQQMGTFFEALDGQLRAIQSEMHTIGKRHHQVYQQHVRDDQNHLQSSQQSVAAWQTMLQESMGKQIAKLKKLNKVQQELFDKEKEQEAAAWTKLAQMVAEMGKSRRSSLASTASSLGESLHSSVDVLNLLQHDMSASASKHGDKVKLKKEEIAALERDLKADQDRYTKISAQFQSTLELCDAHQVEIRHFAKSDTRKRVLEEPDKDPIPSKRAHR
ncbi:P-loop containing nucleoside triphosphate hydrolase protein [Gongronella butleri]|nr:P-loop containing nucleoside triphosphate hydrolase protein [Gongronella butleri]